MACFQSTFEMFLICHSKAIMPLNYLLGVIKSNKFLKAFYKIKEFKKAEYFV